MGKRISVKIKNDLRYSLYTAFQHSMITGIIQISKAKSAGHKVVLATVFLISIIGFLYQFWEFMQLYWQYNTVVDIRVLSSKETTLPSVTVCNLIGLLGSKICRDAKVLYPRMTDDYLCKPIKDLNIMGNKVCDCLPERYCVEGVLKDMEVPSMWLYERMMQKPYKEVINYTQTLDKFVQSCAYISTGANDRPIDCDLSNFKQMIVGSTLISANSICWTINTVIGKPDIMPLTVPSYGNLVLNLTIDETEFPFFLHPPLAKISIHNPNQIINPFFSGSTMFLNSRNKFILKKVVKNLLPPPYKTQCVDYLKRWKENGGIGATNNKECMDECKIRLSLKRFGCVIDELSQIPNQELPCSVVGLLVKQTFNKTDELEAAECIKQNCGSACYEEYYEISQKVTESHNTNKCLEKHYERQKNNNIKLRNIITVEIDLNGMETRTYTYRPKFESIEIFSNLGGYIGLWLGISLIALFDFLEMIFLVIMYPCQKLMEKRK